MPMHPQLEGTGSSISTAEGSAGARCSSSSSLFSKSSSSSSSSDDYHHFLLRWQDGLYVRHQQVEADPPLVPLASHQKLTRISMIGISIDRR
ncbi:hypothetical protein Tco_0297205, partial [Tanacetum coccineum]